MIILMIIPDDSANKQNRDFGSFSGMKKTDNFNNYDIYRVTLSFYLSLSYMPFAAIN